MVWAANVSAEVCFPKLCKHRARDLEAVMFLFWLDVGIALKEYTAADPEDTS